MGSTDQDLLDETILESRDEERGAPHVGTVTSPRGWTLPAAHSWEFLGSWGLAQKLLSLNSFFSFSPLLGAWTVG